MKIPYIRTYGDYLVNWVPLKPTGRWKYVTDIYNENTIFIEHYHGFLNLFKKWTHEDNIEFLEETKEEIFNCKTKG